MMYGFLIAIAALASMLPVRLPEELAKLPSDDNQVKLQSEHKAVKYTMVVRGRFSPRPSTAVRRKVEKRN